MKSGDLVKRANWKVGGTKETIGVIIQEGIGNDCVQVVWAHGEIVCMSMQDLILIEASEDK
tara:strand:- start:10695 stop:10877 length:183 start_codon:yes stop_codon:yes gene_type:complete